jgi:uncharacterized protein (DUF2132 family)
MTTTPSPTPAQPNNPLHGFTLQRILELLLEHNGGFPGLAALLKLNCFSNQPSMNSSLKFLRKTPWARTEVEQLFIRQQLYRHK